MRRARGRAAKRLVTLLQEASGYLRQSAAPAVRLSAALLLTASLAACDSESEEPSVPEPVVSPLSSEVRQGLPSSPGRYDVVPESVHRSDQGVYSFAWKDANGRFHDASVSQLKLAEANQAQLELPGSGDPVLHLPGGVPVRMYSSAAAGDVLPTPTPSGGSSTYVSRYYGPIGYWHPFYVPIGSTRTGDYSTPQYHNPPATTINAGDTVAGTRSSTSAPSPSTRITGLNTAVSGRSGGTGAGTAATGRSSSGGVSAPRSSGFSGGMGSGSAATGKAAS